MVMGKEIPVMVNGKFVAVVKFGKMNRLDVNDETTRYDMSEWRPDLATLQYGLILNTGMCVGLGGWIVFDQYFIKKDNGKTTEDLRKFQFTTGVSKWSRYNLPCNGVDLCPDIDKPTTWSMICEDGKRRKVTSRKQVEKILADQLPCSVKDFDRELVATLRKFADEVVVSKLDSFVY